jgi:poly-beta-1,6-N-acetyl-D-glucosamine synthase
MAGCLQVTHLDPREVAVNSYVVITPVRDETAHIGNVIASMISQTRRPKQWIIVDDGSTDGTSEIVAAAAAQQASWITAVHRANRGSRLAGGGVMEAFYSGHAALRVHDWEYLAKLDGDLSFADDYFERCLTQFEADGLLGIGGGSVCRLEHGGAVIDSPNDPPFHVRGATKIYRRGCWETISPLASTPGWDTIDEVRANRCGWRTKTFSEEIVIQHKPTGSAEGRWANSFKNGRANYFTGYHPLFMLAKCAKRLSRVPPGVDSTALLAGYLSAYWKRLPVMADSDTVGYLRRQQLRRLTMRSSIYG